MKTAGAAGAAGAAGVLVNIAKIDFLVASLRGSAEYIQGSALSIEDLSSCSGINMQEYINFARETSKMIDNYRELINKDLDDISKSKAIYVDADKIAKSIISNSGGAGSGGGFR